MKTKLLLLLTLFISTICLSQPIPINTLENYLNDKSLKLDKITNVKSTNDTLAFYGYKNSDKTKLYIRKVRLHRYEVLGITNWSLFSNVGHWKPLPISLTTVPFKIRPETKNVETTATSGIKNIGFNFDLLRIQMDRYFWDGNKSTHKLFAGIWIAPSVEELNSKETNNYLMDDEKSKQLFMSTGLTVNYTYNNITFTFVPVGFDFATSSIGRKWIYNKKRWWGFGIGLEPKFLSTLKNK